MPTTFTYMPNSTTRIIRKVNLDWSENIIWWKQVLDSYFISQSDTNLSTYPGSTLVWQFPSNITIPPSSKLELQFNAVAKP